MELFDYIKDVSYEKQDIFKDLPEKEEKRYPAYIINQYFSFLPDTLFFANEMNLRSHLDNKMKYHFYLHGLRKRKRFTKWLKQEEIEDLDLICQVYECSKTKGKEYLKLLSKQQISEIKETYHHLINVKS